MTQPSNSVRTACPYCGVGCGVRVQTKPDGSIGVKGDPDHPANFGRLCSKGTALGETLGLEDRLLEPSINGQPASWDDALDLIAARFSSIIAEDGPDAIGFYVSGQLLTEDYYAANKLMKGVIGSANIDTNSRLCMASSVAGHKRAFGSDTVPGIYEDLEQADLIILTGSNLAWCHPVLYQRILSAKQTNPALKVVLIDPRRTRTADLADLHLPIRPDGDVALFLGLLARIGQSDCFNADYVSRHTNGMQDALAIASDVSLEALQVATGLHETQLEAFFELFLSNEKTVTIYSQGVNQSRYGTDKVNAIINCHLATGRIGRPGMGPFSVTGQPNAMGGREVGGLANMLACHMDIENADHRELVSSFWDTDRLPNQQGLKAIDLFDAVAKGRIKALWIMATNPVDSMPDADAVREAIKACPLVIVSDVQASTDTLDLAHIKLPSLAWGEKSGTVTNSERCISRQRAVLPPPGEARGDWWQMAQVGKRMGFPTLFDWQGPADIFREYAALSAHENHGRRDFDIGLWADQSDASYEDMAPFQWPMPKGKQDTPSETRFFKDGGFFTPDGKARAIAVQLPVENKTEPASGQLILNTGRVRDHWHTMTRTGRSARLSAHLAEPYCELSPSDAATYDVKDADLVHVHNDQGKILVRAMISDRVSSGEIFVPFHWTDQVSANARVGRLIPAEKDPVSGQPASKSTQVSLTKVPMGSYGFAILKERPDDLGLPYWALAKCKQGWRLEFALQEPPSTVSADHFERHFSITTQSDPLAYIDHQRANKRFAWFGGEQLLAAVFLAEESVQVSRDFAAGLLAGKWDSFAQRTQVIATIPGSKMPDKGKIICACMNVGQNQIAVAVAKGCCSVDEVGEATTAGTNCGSCKPEISEMLVQLAAQSA